MSRCRLWFLISISIVGVVACATHSKPRPVPPELELLEFRMLVPMLPVAGKSYLEATVAAVKEYKKPSSVGDCGAGTWTQHDFVMEPDDDFIDFQLASREGVGTQPSDARAYQLFKFTPSGAEQQVWSLIMKQAAVANAYLNFVTWRLKVNATEISIQKEVGDGSVAMPPAGQSPWERKFESSPVSGVYQLHALNSTLPSGITGSLTLRLEVKLPKFCEVR